ncbi:MAG: hypothetical protein ACM3NQ_21765 [Bacteroidales bacterium]
MKRRDKSAVGFFVVLLSLVLAAAVLYFTGWGAIVRNVAVLGWRGNEMVSLAKRTPFTPPRSGTVAEQRLQSYLEVCERIKPFGDKIDEWEAEHSSPGRTTSFKGRAAGLVEGYLHEFNLALRQQQMGPAEFAWIESRMRQAAEGAPSGFAPQSDRLLYAEYRDRLTRSAAGTHALKIALGFAE